MLARGRETLDLDALYRESNIDDALDGPIVSSSGSHR
jgi:hypothetical protein